MSIKARGVPGTTLRRHEGPPVAIIPLYVYNKGWKPAIVAQIYSDGVLRKSVKTGEHQKYRPPGWAFSKDHIKQLQDAVGVSLELTSSDGHIYRATTEQFTQYCIPIQHKHYEPQWLLPMPYWGLDGKRAKRPHEAPPQVALF